MGFCLNLKINPKELAHLDNKDSFMTNVYSTLLLINEKSSYLNLTL
jgi:hypothetical protein